MVRTEQFVNVTVDWLPDRGAFGATVRSRLLRKCRARKVFYRCGPYRNELLYDRDGLPNPHSFIYDASRDETMFATQRASGHAGLNLCLINWPITMAPQKLAGVKRTVKADRAPSRRKRQEAGKLLRLRPPGPIGRVR